MRKRALCFAASAFVLLASTSLAFAQPRLQNLFKLRRYFDLREEVSRSGPQGPEASFYKGLIANRFGDYEESDLLLQAYLKQEGKLTNRQEALVILADNANKEHDYARGAGCYDQMLQEFRPTLDARAIEDYENVAGMWRSIAEAPRQTVSISGESTLSSKPGILTLWPVQIGSARQGMLLDTGANISVIRRSLAKQYGFQLMSTTVMVTGFTGTKTPAVMGIAPELKLGSATIRNSIFLVFEDSALKVGPDVQIDGLIGFPIISALGRLSFYRNGDIKIAKPQKRSGEPTMCIDGLDILVDVKRGERRLILQLDTGADRTILYPPFLGKFREDIEANGKPVTNTVGGVGGAKQVPSFQMEMLKLSLGGKDVTLPRATIHKEPTSMSSRVLDGNIGRDLIRQFDSMTLDFKAMQISFD